jgi:hypothetical protein
MLPRTIEAFCSSVLPLRAWRVIPNLSSGLANVITCPLPFDIDSKLAIDATCPCTWVHW